MVRYYRLKKLSKLLKLSSSKVLSYFTYKYRKRLYCLNNQRWYEFSDPKDVIIPSTAIRNKLISLNLDEPLLKLLESDVEPPPDKVMDVIPKIPVVAILGHYDHGKTTLLDALGNTGLLNSDYDGVTQVFLLTSTKLLFFQQ
jgi:polynucleotide 5'-kinase involved in rRNA processing